MEKLTFDEKTHCYRDINGVIIPSVTQVIQDAGLVDLSWINKDLLQEKADLGHKVHSTTELYDLGELDLDELHPTLRAYLDQWIKFRKDYNFVPSEIERMLIHPAYRYAGRIDRSGLIGKDYSVVDIKSGTKQISHTIQTAAYKELLESNSFPKIKKRLCVYLTPDNYKVEENKDPNDKAVFLACLTVANFKHKK